MVASKNCNNIPSLGTRCQRSLRFCSHRALKYGARAKFSLAPNINSRIFLPSTHSDKDTGTGTGTGTSSGTSTGTDMVTGVIRIRVKHRHRYKHGHIQVN